LGGLPPDSVVQTEDEILCDCERLISTYHDPARYSMCQVSIAPCSPFSVTREEMCQAAVWAREHRLTLHTHVAETLDEERFCLAKFNKRPIALMEDLGWLGADVWFAHCVHLDQDEIKLMAETNTGVAHCPSSNMRLGSGIAPIRELRDAGVRVGLAVDGSASNDSSHMLAEARQAMLLQRVTKGAAALSAREAFEIATRGGADVLCRDDIGVLAPGMAADVIGWKVDALDYAGAQHDPLAALLFCAPRAVDLSVINGQVVVWKGQVLGIDVPRLVAQHNETSRKVMTDV
jgi:cytosine/adenosine deaminase-related metal-dependent hydrolase